VDGLIFRGRKVGVLLSMHAKTEKDRARGKTVTRPGRMLAERGFTLERLVGKGASVKKRLRWIAFSRVKGGEKIPNPDKNKRSVAIPTSLSLGFSRLVQDPIVS
jgi:hypothetical protein